MLSGGFDLGIFEQGIRSYAHGQFPISTLKGPHYNLLGDHFHPILILLAPFYRIFPSPVTLLVAQAALMALAIPPLVRWAYRQQGIRLASVVGFGFGASWGIVQAVHFDFHEVCFAVPLLARCLPALGAARWRAAAAWGAPLLLVKEDLGLTFAAVGLYIAWKGPRRLGATVACLGIAGSAVEVLVVLPAFNPQGVFSYWGQVSAAGAAPDGSGMSAAALPGLLLHALWPPTKWLTVLMLFAPTGFLAMRSPLALLTLPTLAWRFLSANPNYWGMLYHYNAVLIPIVFAAMVDAAGKGCSGHTSKRVKKALMVGAVVTSATIPVTPLREVLLPSTWSTPVHVTAARHVLSRIPDGTTVAASNRLAAQLTSRTTVSMICAPAFARPATPPQWVVADLTDPTLMTIWPCSPTVLKEALQRYRSEGYEVVALDDGVELLHRPE